jgi:hypothetical protein
MGFVLEEKCSVRLNNSETIPELWFLVPLEMSMNTNLKGDCWLNRKSSHRPAVTTLVIPLVLLCFGLSPKMQAVIPAPDGGSVGQNTPEGDDALFSLTTGFDNAAIERGN